MEKVEINKGTVKVKINIFNNINVDVEGFIKHINNVISNPINFSKFVRDWLHSADNIGMVQNEQYRKYYNNICNTWKERYVKDDDVTLRYYFSEDNWDMVIEIFKNCN